MLTATDFDLAQSDRLLTTTRAVRKRLDLQRPVPRQVVLDCLRIATQAPTGGNSQPWRWLVLDEPEVRAGLAEIYRRGFEPYMAAQQTALVANGNDPDHPIVTSSRYLADHLHEVPVLVVPCFLGRLPEPASTAEVAGVLGSLLPAVWSFMLALRSRRVGAALTTMHLAFEREVGEVLKIPDTVTQVGLLPVAYYTGETFRPAKRRPVEQVTYWNEWRGRTLRR